MRWACWIFDLDGTLTEAVHDFAAIRRELGLAPGVAILEALEALPADEARRRRERLDAWERGLAEVARPAPGAAELLGRLRDGGVPRGVLTRNTRPVALRTLEVAGLHDRFEAAHCLGRTCAAPKPSPEGIHRLLRAFGGRPSKAVMVGDHLHDLAAGRAAGVATVLVDPDGRSPHRGHADLVVRTLAELHALA